MKKRLTKIGLTSVSLFLITLLFSQNVKGQSVWVQNYSNNAKWGIELRSPAYSFTGDSRGFDLATYLYTNIPVSEKWGVRLVFPISRFIGGGTKLASGNPLIAFQYINRNSGIKLDFGARLPLVQADIDAPSAPFPPTPVFKIGAFNELKTAVHFNIQYRWGDASGWVYKIGNGLRFIAGADGPVAMLYNYYGQVLYKINNFTFGGGFRGHFLRGGSHHLVPGGNRLEFGLLGSYDFGRYKIGLFLKNNVISEFDIDAPFVIGFNFTVNL